STILKEASAKNVFTVGSVVDDHEFASGDPGSLYSGSSGSRRGPTADLRWKPNIAAPGRMIRSVAAATTNGYTNKWGTSMASPHVPGLAAQLADHYSFLQYNPSTMGALLMASAITKDNQLLTSPSTSSTSHYN